MIPDTPAGRQASWYLSLIEGRGESASLADADRYAPDLFARMRPVESEEALREGFARWSDELGPLTVGRVDEPGEDEIAVVLDASDGKRWRLTCQVEPDSPHRITRLVFKRALDESVTARLATEADGPALGDLERRCPIELGDVSVTIDRGDDWWAFARLVDDVGVGIALVDGELAAMNCGVIHRVRIGVQEVRMMVAVHLRVLPEHQRKGLWGAATDALYEQFPWADAVDASVGYVSTRNLGMQAGFRHNPNKWSFGPTRAVFDCRTAAGPPAGRPATPADAAGIVEMVNACHEDEEMFLPYSVASLTARLERAPHLYSWDRVWLTDGAVVGVWASGDCIRIITEQGGKRSVIRRDMVVDYGWLPGAEAEFEPLLRAWCAAGAARGIDELSIFTSPASPGADRICELASSTEDFLLWMNGVDEPADAASRGIYTDQLYF